MTIIPDLTEIKKGRNRAGLSQTRLASMVGISQSHLAKIESGKVDSSYSLVSRLFDALERMEKDECWQYMSKEIMTTRKGDKVDEIALEMKNRGYSQVPVFEEGKPIGLLTERRILDMKKPYDDLLVEEAMEEAVIVPKETNYAVIIPLLKQFQAVLVQDKGKMVGIITSTDLIGIGRKLRDIEKK